MQFLSPYLRQLGQQTFTVSAEQGSRFAKQVAGDFNPIHHADSRRFVVPGDLLFAISLQQYGLHQQMSFQFLDLVAADTELTYASATEDGAAEVVNGNGKPVLGIEMAGNYYASAQLSEQLLKNYVAFSGQNFPHILVPLMREHQVMINPARPLVIYQSMSFELGTTDIENIEVQLAQTSLDVQGKRGDALLHFDLTDGSEVIGKGFKKLVLSGLRDYDEDQIQAMCDKYAASQVA